MSPSYEQYLTKVRLLATPSHDHSYLVQDDNGLWRKWKRSWAEKQILSIDADPSPLPPTILPAWGFGMTRGCRSRVSGAGRHQILLFPRNILSPGPASPYKPLPCHPEPPDGGSGKVKGGEGSASTGKDQDYMFSSNENIRLNTKYMFDIGIKETQSFVSMAEKISPVFPSLLFEIPARAERPPERRSRAGHGRAG